MSDAIEVFVTDLDHTLLHPETKDIPDALPDLLEEWMERGNKWVIATGRDRSHLEDVMDELRLRPNYYITRSRYIHPGTSRNHPELDEWNRKIEDLLEKQDRYADKWIPKLRDWVEKKGMDVDLKDGYAMFESPSDAETAFHYLSDVIAEGFKVLRNHEFLIVVPAQTGKGNCLKHLSETRNWQESEIFCVGDGMNDANMLDGDYDYKKAAVANAEPKLKDLVAQHGGIILEHVGGDAIEHLLRTLMDDTQSSKD
ncbi:MAG: HAD family hydrolase [bacterium]